MLKIFNPTNYDPTKIFPKNMQIESRYFLHLIMRTTAQDKRYQERDFVILNSTALRQQIGRNKAKIITDRLEDKGIIECNGFYLKGKQSFGFRLSADYVKEFVKLTISNKTLERNINKHHRPQPLTPIQLTIQSWNKLLRIDDVKARHTILTSGKSPEWVNNRLIHLDSIVTQDHKFKPDKYGRLHTNITNAWSPIRKYMYLENTLSELVQIDIPNSQPLFFASTLKQLINEGEIVCNNKLISLKQLLNSNLNINSTLIKKPKQEGTNPIPFLYDGTFNSNLINNSTLIKNSYLSKKPKQEESNQYPFLYDGTFSDVNSQLQEFINLTQDSLFYETMMKKVNYKGTRQSFKKLFYSNVLYSNYIYPSKERDAFEKSYPLASKFLDLLKGKGLKQTKDRKTQQDKIINIFNHPTTAAKTMQEEEAYFVIDTCCQRIHDENPKIPILTIHDSIVTTAKYAEQVKLVMDQEFSSIGLSPELKIMPL